MSPSKLLHEAEYALQAAESSTWATECGAEKPSRLWGLSVPPPASSLLDRDSFEPWDAAIGDGVFAGYARIGGRRVCAWLQDGTYRGGSLGAQGGALIADALRRANRTGVPVIGLPRSAGARLQEGVAALNAYSVIFREQARARVPQITVVGGTCAGGAAYSPALGDIVIMYGADSRLFLTGPKVVERVTRERVDPDLLGGVRVHARNGVAHLAAGDEHSARKMLRHLLTFLPSAIGEPTPRFAVVDPPCGSPADHVPVNRRRVYDMCAVVSALLDGGEYLDLGGGWARNMLTGFGRLGGRAVGVIANQPRHMGGVIDHAAAEKGAWFVSLCDRFGIPMLVLVDTPGFLPGVSQERAGVIRYGAQLLRAFGRATVPRVTVTIRQAYGGAHIVMNSVGLGATSTMAWPDASMGIMGARQAVEIIERRALERGVDPDLLAERYSETALKVELAVKEGFIGEVVAPAQTRIRLINALESAG